MAPATARSKEVSCATRPLSGFVYLPPSPSPSSPCGSGAGRPVRTSIWVRLPTLVIHGLDDPLVHPEGGRHTAAQVPGTRLEEIAGMGHDLPLGLMPTLVELVLDHVRKARVAEAG